MDGMFQHDPMEPPPRKMIWDPIDKGVGDGDIIVAKEPVPRFTGPSTSGVLRKRIAAETAESIEERKRKKPKGLLGGGLGGEPAAPEVFMQWTRAHNDVSSYSQSWLLALLAYFLTFAFILTSHFDKIYGLGDCLFNSCIRILVVFFCRNRDALTSLPIWMCWALLYLTRKGRPQVCCCSAWVIQKQWRKLIVRKRIQMKGQVRKQRLEGYQEPQEDRS